MENYGLQIRYLPFYNADERMKKSIKKMGRRVIKALVPGLFLMTSQAFGQSLSGACDATNLEVLPGSHILSAPYRDLNPFNNLPGEINQWGLGTVYLNTGDSVTGRFLVYNALGSNLLSVKYGTETIFLVDKSTVKGFVFRSEKSKEKVITYQFFAMADWYYSNGEGAFLEVLVKDTVSLYCLVTIEKFPMSDNLKGHYYYFIQQSAGDLKRALPNRRNLCRTLGCSDEFRKNLRSLHLRTNKRDRMIHSLKEYNRFITAQ
jgi:hypothetical protein